MDNNHVTWYLLSGFDSEYELNSEYLKFTVKEILATLIRLEISTQGRISFVRKIANGKIKSVNIENETFDSAFGFAKVRATIENTDSLSGDFQTELVCQGETNYKINPVLKRDPLQP